MQRDGGLQCGERPRGRGASVGGSAAAAPAGRPPRLQPHQHMGSPQVTNAS